MASRHFLQWAKLALALAALPLLAACPQSGGSGAQRASLAVADLRAKEVESLARLTAEGQLLLKADRFPKNGYDYCRDAAGLAERGDFRLAIREASKALFLAEQTSDAYLRAHAKRDIAVAYSYAGQLDLAAQYAEEAITDVQLSRRSVAPIYPAAYKVLGDVSLRENKPVQALSNYEEALNHAGEALQPFIRIAMANALRAKGDAAAARQALEKLLAERQSGRVQALARRALGQALLEGGDAGGAERHFAEALAGNPDGYDRVWVLAGLGRAQAAGGRLDAAADAYGRAVAEAERLTAEFRSDEFRSGLFGDLGRIFQEAKALELRRGNAARAFEYAEAGKARAFLDLVRGRVQTSAGHVAVAAQAGGAVSTTDIQRAVAASERGVLVAYSLGADGSYAFVLRGAEIRAVPIQGGEAEIGDAVSRYLDALRALAPVDGPQADLHRRLVAPLGLVPGERLVIVPDGPLFRLPFHALHDGQGYLIQRHEIAYAPSAAIHAALLARPRGEAAPIVAFGNPKRDGQVDLPAAAREAEEIGRLHPRARVFTGAEATKARFVALAAESGALHVAAHAELDQVDPLYSTILLAAGEGGGGDLEAREVYGLDLRKVGLVALSACETGLGLVSRGQEFMGFVRTFLAAGAAGTMVSLWQIEDEATARIMTAFYREASSRDAPAALRQAILDYLGDGRRDHPYFWAAFALHGDPRIRLPAAATAALGR
ncbi:MAG: CHAT domain-containing protein [Alphaproteobacteria bacterium]|nr:CHAT domain-containing protein [Alphaproteobacteria bacterium]